MKKLAIIIPAYKEKYFEKTLHSLAMQTNKDFTLYIGDDFSPFDLKKISDKFKDILNIKYTRFPENIGSKNLVLQWKRCIELAENEEWLWLFSDDDLIDQDCVENFYQIIEENAGKFDVYRFNTITIDNNDNKISEHPLGPKIESSEEMAYQLLIGNRGNSMPDHIFSKEIYTHSGGFVFTDYAQGADWASSILFSKNKGMCIIPKSQVYWRYSGNNISSLASQQKDDMIEGHLQFIAWTRNHFEYLKCQTSIISYDMMIDALKINLTRVMIYHYKGYNFRYSVKLFNSYRHILNQSFYNSFKELIKINETVYPTVKFLTHFVSNIKNLAFRSHFSIH